MPDFKYFQNPITKKWVVLAPRRSKRPDVAKGIEPVCPFCPGKEGEEKEIYRIEDTARNEGKQIDLINLSNLISKEGLGLNDPRVKELADKLGIKNLEISDLLDQSEELKIRNCKNNNTGNGLSNWAVRVLPNKFPFSDVHELIIHSPDHNNNFDKLSLHQVELIIKTYKNRYLAHQAKGQVYIFHNRGEGGGESLPHPHTQVAVIPFEVKTDLPRLDPQGSVGVGPKALTIDEQGQGMDKQEMIETPHFYMFCPLSSGWPDEIWVCPKNRGRLFGEITDEEIADLAYTLQRLLQIFDLRHNNIFPFNMYIYPGGDWYLRIIPRLKSLGGFEIGTGILVNTQDPKETMAFIKAHFEKPDKETIVSLHQAKYSKGV